MRGAAVEGTPRAGRPGRRTDWFLVGLWVALVGLALVWIMPFVFMLMTSLKPEEEISGAGILALPRHPTLANYAAAWHRGNFSRDLLNSVIITAVKVPVGILVSAAAAYALCRIRFRGAEAVFLVFLFGTMVPFQVLLAPLFSLVHGLGLTNSYVGVILPYIAFGVPYQVFVLRGFFRGIPNELFEAAMLDGASHLAIFARIVLPLAVPALAALFILDFVATWNEFAMALDGPREGNPFGDVRLEAVFSREGREVRAAGFHDGDGIHRVRFMPDEEGEWRYVARFDRPEGAGEVAGSFRCAPARPGVHGPAVTAAIDRRGRPRRCPPPRLPAET